ncbi:chorismate-binding protein [Sanguibacter hominis]|uniref:chorismate-binding protein n=1 Tax=Sanguibacter hominis TaxID=1312739 RepID=UPI003D9C6334
MNGARPAPPDEPERLVARGSASLGGTSAHGVTDCVDLATVEGRARLDDEGLWFVVLDFDGLGHAWRFAERTSDGAADDRAASAPVPVRTAWRGPAADTWRSSAGADRYRDDVARVRERVREGDVYQVNLCRVLSAPLPATGGQEPDATALATRLATGNPAPFGGYVHVPAGAGVEPVWVVTASPELFLRRDGTTLTSAPIKGTAADVGGLLPKDEAENIMITDLVRNDLQHVCQPGTVSVESLLAVEQHPGLVHLVSTVTGELRDDVGWAQVLDATFPPASVSGAPKSSALRIIDTLEDEPRGPYCGAIGWVDADRGTAELAVGIRTFWWRDGVLRFGTGAGITWGSDPGGEWDETELKARRLVALASS